MWGGGQQFPLLRPSGLQVLTARTGCPIAVAYEPKGSSVCRNASCSTAEALWTAVAPHFPEVFFARVTCDDYNASCGWVNRTLIIDNPVNESRSASSAGPPVIEFAVGGTAHRYADILNESTVRRWVRRNFFQATGTRGLVDERPFACAHETMRSKLSSHRLSRHPYDWRTPVPPSTGLGEWIFVAHHRSGSKVGKAVVQALCGEFDRPVIVYSYREPPIEPNRRRAALCHFHTNLLPEDLDVWLERLWRDPHNRLIHFVHDPVAMVHSGYEYHKSQAEMRWTNSTACSQKLCMLPETWGINGTNVTANDAFKLMATGLWLREYGCVNFSTYYSCLSERSTDVGLRAEAKRAYPTLRAMVDIDLLAKGPRTFTLPLIDLVPEVFNTTIQRLASFLAAANASKLSQRQQHSLTLRAYNNTFFVPPLVSPPNSTTRIDPMLIYLRSAKAELPADRSSTRQMRSTPAVHELAARSRWSPRFTWPRLFSPVHRKLPFKRGSRGVVTCTAPKLFNQTLLMLSRLQKVGTSLPVEIWHVDELSAREQQQLRKHPALGKGIAVRDLTRSLSPTLLLDEIKALRGFLCKPLALLASNLDQILLVDHDARFFVDPALLFDSDLYTRTGMLLFRDRLRLQIKGRPVKDASRYVRQLIRRRMGSAHFWKAAEMPPMPFPWRPSKDLMRSPIVTGESNHEIDSSVLLMSKQKAPQVITSLYILHERYRHEVYANVHGDKETYWLACELVGGIKCGVSEYAAGEMGRMAPLPTGDKSCLLGNLMQFHPDNPKWAVHCNCKPEAAYLYTHVARPQRYSDLLAYMARVRLAASLQAGQNLSRKMFTPHASLSVAWRQRAARNVSVLRLEFDKIARRRIASTLSPPIAPQFCSLSSLETVEAMIARQPQNERAVQMNKGALCLQYGLLCRRRNATHRDGPARQSVLQIMRQQASGQPRRHESPMRQAAVHPKLHDASVLRGHKVAHQEAARRDPADLAARPRRRIRSPSEAAGAPAAAAETSENRVTLKPQLLTHLGMALFLCLGFGGLWLLLKMCWFVSSSPPGVGRRESMQSCLGDRRASESQSQEDDDAGERSPYTPYANRGDPSCLRRSDLSQGHNLRRYDSY